MQNIIKPFDPLDVIAKSNVVVPLTDLMDPILHFSIVIILF